MLAVSDTRIEPAGVTATPSGFERAAAPAGPGAVLAVLLGTNIGPNLTYAGSLATLLWRRIVHEHEHEVEIGEFTRLGLLTVPAALILATLALWVSLTVIGG